MGIRVPMLPARVDLNFEVQRAVDSAVLPYRQVLREIVHAGSMADEGLLEDRDARDLMARAALRQLGTGPPS